MVKLTKIYTRNGDKGQTQIAGGHDLAKTSARIDAIGNIDELNSWIGLISANVDGKLADFKIQLEKIQNQLFNLGAQLAVLKADRRENTPIIEQADIDALETAIDQMNETLPTLQSFILPGGNALASELHIARNVCRRAERSLFKLNETEPVETIALSYLNRLSDYLFVSARFVCQQCQVAEILWHH